MTPERIIEAADDLARHIIRTTTIDLDAFLALDGDARAARWRQWDRAAKFQAVAQMLNRRFGDWSEEEIDRWIAHYDSKWSPLAPLPISDLTVPPTEDILALVKERFDAACYHGDVGGAGQLDRVRMNLLRGARLSWHLGDLLIQSVNNPGQVYSVSRRGCTCPNGRKGRHDCWHVALFDLLIDMADEAAATADMAADAAARDAGATPTDDDDGPWSQEASLGWAEHAAEQRLWGRVSAIRAEYLRAA